MSAARFWWTCQCLFTVGSSRLTDLPMDRGALTVRVSCRTAAGCSVTGWSPAAHCEAGDATADFTHLRAGHVSLAQGSPRLQADSLSCNARAAKRRRKRGERAAPYNFCGPYRLAPCTPSCTNRCRSPAACCRLRRSL
ncbi:unnamed protein product [Pleuronectes platessa]|uniref:Secreted protein n=1 Tax=Pleuronectes platessa TaxID=8262 RepID=A0A9N7ZA50_PLEPL|nr:unnamed protein product [Pleuronectes platessa]